MSDLGLAAATGNNKATNVHSKINVFSRMQWLYNKQNQLTIKQELDAEAGIYW